MTNSNLKIGIFIMQKNEFDLFPIFIKYYGNLVGYSNIHVVDNGSSKDMLPLLKNASDLGVNVDFSYSRETDFKNKGKIIQGNINKVVLNYDICIPLDCDEFIGVEIAPNTYTFDKDLIIKYFSDLPNGLYELKAKNRFRNSITDYTKFYRASRPLTKVFTKKTEFAHLDLGYHRCEGDKSISSVCYFELHNKPYDIFYKLAVEKMKNRVDLKNIDRYNRYVGAGYHLLRYLGRKGKVYFYRDLNSKDYRDVPGLMNTFDKLNIEIPKHLRLNNGDHKKYEPRVL